MAVETRSMEVVTCDGCGREQVTERDGDPVDGFYGEVRQIASWGGSGEVSWYACRSAHIKLAVLAALQQAEDAASG